MVTTAGLCSPGFYCIEGSSSTRQTPCPSGRYCERGTHHPKLCPAGTFFNGTMARKERDCIQCTAGKYCEISGLTMPTGICQDGYYCPRGSVNKTAVECPIGTYCPTESSQFRKCPAGMYTDYTKASQCDLCPKRYFCIPENVMPGKVFVVLCLLQCSFFCIYRVQCNVHY